MNFLAVIMPVLAATDPAEILKIPSNQAPSNITGMHFTDVLIVIAVSLAILISLIAWALFIRKPKSETTRVRVHKSHDETEELDDGSLRKRKKHKKQRRAHRTRNPTLSEAGGLPPMRTDDTPPPI